MPVTALLLHLAGCGPTPPGMDASETGETGETGGATDVPTPTVGEATGASEPDPTGDSAHEPTTGAPPPCPEGLQCDLPACPSSPFERSTLQLGGEPTSLLLLDVDGDADLDLVAAERHEGRLEMAINDGAGNFTPGTMIAVGDVSNTLHLVAGDLDGDEILDLVVSSLEPDTLVVARGQGGTFVPGPALASELAPWGLAIARVDDDPFPDLVGVDFQGEFAVVWRGDGKGGLQPAQLAPEVVTTFNGAVLDFDGDGLADLVGAPPQDSLSITLARAAGDGGYILDAPLADAPSGVTSVLVGDLGGATPIIVAPRVEMDGGGVTVWRAEAPSSWSAALSYSVSQPLFGGTLIDFDGDSTLDLVSASLLEVIVVLPGDGQGGFRCEQEHVLPDTFISPSNLAVGDVNGDARPDILVGGLIDGVVTVLLQP